MKEGCGRMQVTCINYVLLRVYREEGILFLLAVCLKCGCEKKTAVGRYLFRYCTAKSLKLVID